MVASHRGQETVRAKPHPTQNLASSLFSALHCPQRIVKALLPQPGAGKSKAIGVALKHEKRVDLNKPLPRIRLLHPWN
jgi:hypothetical protein